MRKLFVAGDRLVVGVALGGDARAYPLQFIGYHHQVRDTVGGTPILVSYCTVCRTGRVFSPMVGAQAETFRLVGMDHFNAMLEDRTTGSWWRQANGEAITGPRRGTMLTELPRLQVTLKQWLALHPKQRLARRSGAGVRGDGARSGRFTGAGERQSGVLAQLERVPATDRALLTPKAFGLELTAFSQSPRPSRQLRAVSRELAASWVCKLTAHG